MISLEKEKIYYNALNLIFETNYLFLKKLYQKFGSFVKIYQEIPNLSVSQKIFERFKKTDPFLEFEKLKRKKIVLILFFEKNFPKILKETQNFPLGLYVLSSLPLKEIFYSPSIAVVGTRKATNYGKEIAKRFSFELASLGFNIISGLASGIDTCAHQGAIEGRGKTIAVLGSGIDLIYPQINLSLSQKIKNQGAIISEYPLGSPPMPYHFPERNRIISGLSLGILVVEAPKKSGALITAKFGLEDGREIFTIPGSIFWKNFEGNHNLIKKGAKLVENIEDVLEEIKDQVQIELPKKEIRLTFKNNQEKEVFEIIKNSNEGIEFDKISINSKISPEKVASILSLLEVKGFIKEIKGKYYPLTKL
ncbi:DNA-processing protein DprA [bacterium]|nr:DNA-processing protein DprA [bacterium]